MIIKGIKSKSNSDKREKYIKEEKTRLAVKRRKIFINRGAAVSSMSYKGIGGRRDKTFQDRLAARMLLIGFEPYVIAETLRIDPYQFRKRIVHDKEFKQLLLEFGDELFDAVENKQKHLMKEALDKLSALLKHEDPEINLESIDKIFRIHGKYIERTEDMTPVERKMTPDVAERLLDKGIEYLRLSKKEPKLIEGKVIDIGKD